MKKYKAGLFGLGVVGSGVYQSIKADGEFPVSIKKIAVKNPQKQRNFPVDKDIIYTDANDLLNDDTLDIIIELINDPHEAFEIVAKALRNGKFVVTANKKMISLYHQELLRIRKENEGVLLYEGAVCGSIPIIRLLDQQFSSDEIRTISTIANGTCNYILSQMSAQGWPYDKALQEAQKLGFAELDSYSDVSGEDTRFKLSILILHSFGIHVAAEDIPMIGIEQVSKEAIDFAKSIDAEIKLVGKAEWNKGKLTASVAPEFVGASEDFSQVHQEYNAVQVDAKYAGLQFFKGKGAGSWPTSSAVLSNLKDITKDICYQFPKSAQTISNLSSLVDTYYISGKESILNRLDFEKIVDQGKDYWIVKASLTALLKTIKEGATFTCIRLPENILKINANTGVLV
ncbi:homoserine dehydrogenase [Marivirga sp. S37H4]|uniref:Homoserine dehydrogenase n=1 Tax=Marivirga aurantiaca TaxID=2802615 RepID=A0A934WVG9_9BACT|nr:homoserine dehydrogenase [Marivirga aurantiaca]MBK6263793.1 homoserine dehydrogenase [Marivirga aurantiaca]